jgi:O-antigen ligase
LAPGDAGAASAAAGGAAIAAILFTLSAYVGSPLLLPAAMIAAAFAAVVITSPAWGLVLAFCAVPLEAVNIQLGPTGLSPAEAALAAVGFAWYVRFLFGREQLRGPGVGDLPLLLFLVIVGVGIVISDEPFTVARILVLWTLFAGVYFQARALAPDQVRRVLAAFAIGVGIIGTIGAIGYLRSGDTGLLQGGLVTGARAVGAFSDANYYAALLVLALLPGIALLIADPRRYAWLGAPVAGGAAGLAFSLSRGAIAAFVLGLLLLLAWRRARWLALSLAVLFALTAAGNVNPIVKSQQFQTVQERLSTLSEATTETSTANRPRIWATAIDVAENHPFFGIGVNQFKHESARHAVFEHGSPLENAHSIPMSLAAETGLLGLAAFIAFYAQLLLRGAAALRTSDPLNFVTSLGLLAALVAFALQGLTVVQIRVNVIMASFLCVGGLVTALAARASADAESAG